MLYTTFIQWFGGYEKRRKFRPMSGNLTEAIFLKVDAGLMSRIVCCYYKSQIFCWNWKDRYPLKI